MLNHANEMKDEQLTCLNTLFLKNLQHSIQSVRQGASISLSNVFKTCFILNDSFLNNLLNQLNEKFVTTIEILKTGEINNEQIKSENCQSLYTPYTTMVVKQTGIKNDARNRLKRLKKPITKESIFVDQASCEDDIGMINKLDSNQPWHFADGYLYFIYELSAMCTNNNQLHKNFKLIKSFLNKQFDLILKLLSIRTYNQHVNILETFCKLVG